MISRSPNLFLSKGGEPSFAKFQPSKSLIFDKLPTIKQITQTHERSNESDSISDGPSADGSTVQETTC